MKIAVLAVLAAAGVAQAESGSVAYMASIPLTTTNWDEVLSIPQFKPDNFGGATLTSVTWELFGGVEGNARFESLDAAPATITLNLQAEVVLFAPDATQLGVVIPAANTSDDVDAFDNVIDFGGASGRTYLGLTGFDTASANSSDAAFLAQFIGSGNVLLPVSADGTSVGTGAGNLITQFQTEASAMVRIKYDYIPAPGAAALLGLGALVAGRRRR